MSARLLIVCLDGADGRTLDRATRDGTLPNLAAMRARGQAWTLVETLGVTDDSRWASFQYGAGLGEHGRYASEIQTVAGQRYLAITREQGLEAFWEKLSSRNLRTAILDVPKCPVPRPLNGIHLADWSVHGRYFHPLPRAHPETLVGDVLERFGAPPPSCCDFNPGELADDDVRAICANLYRSVAQKRDAGMHYLTAEPWDLFVIGFKEAHCTGHMLWDLADPAHVRYDSGRAARLGNPLLDVLKEQDRAIGELIAAAGPDANVVVFASSDFGPNGSILHLMPKIAKRVNRHIRRPIAERMLRGFVRLTGLGTPLPFCLSMKYSDDLGALRIPRQRDDDNKRFAERLDLIETIYRELTDVDDGLPVIAAVTRPASEHIGPRAAVLPDMLLHYRRNVFPRAVESARLGRIDAPRPKTMRTGNHDPGGFALAVGPEADRAAQDIGALEDFAGFATQVLAGRSNEVISA